MLMRVRAAASATWVSDFDAPEMGLLWYTSSGICVGVSPAILGESRSGDRLICLWVHFSLF